ncbi:hypothetical protein BC937DRAFT_89925 [Endogone sp. FLAS-F59071]|nr:hypothetical protein BC937DRAFT_89925 [Endogone sp. FLAS-F59071]|eukprot:RUS22234.1 hypothetical protein BC937DRAFT_89925 [Endogone sp. FLAS-F59071]
MSEFSRTNLFTAPLPRISQSIAVPLSRKFARLRNPQNLNEDAESLTGPENIIAGPIHQNKPVSSVPNGLGDPMKIKRSKTSQALDRTKTEKSRKRPAPEDQEKTAQQYKADTLDILAVNAGIDSTPPITSVSPSEMFVNNESMSEEPRRLRLRDEDDFDDLLRRHEEITQAAGIGEPKSAGAMVGLVSWDMPKLGT